MVGARLPYRIALRIGRSAALVVVVVCCLGAAAQEVLEYELKAVFLYRFAGFIEWPTTGQVQPDSSFTIGLLGDDRFGDAFASLRGKSIGGRPVVVRRLRNRDQIAQVDILYISDSESDRLRQILAEIAARPVLTVGDSPDFLTRGGMIRFVVHGRRIQFQVNRCAADRAGLRISGRLLEVAERVGNRCVGSTP